MGTISRRKLLAGTAAVAAAAAGTAIGATAYSHNSAARRSSPTPASSADASSAPSSPPPGRLIGDGSTADTGKQPHQPTPERLAPGQRPPQFVVFSWDGAGEDSKRLFSHFRQVAKETKASMTFFLSGIYILPESEKHLYRPPRKPVGASAIGYLKDEHIRATIQQIRLAWLEGHEIGTHFNGHFCDPAGVGTWTPAEWRSEIEQAIGFVQHWKTNTGFHDLDPLPFDYRKELIGGRTPCLLGQDRLLPTAKALGWKYDASSPGGLQIWPAKRGGLWDLPLQSIPFPGHSFSVLSMDYNMMVNQSGGLSGARAQRGRWQRQAAASYLAGFDRAYTGNRAPLFIGNHFERWNGGIYMKAVEHAMREMAAKPDVRLVSFRQLTQWLDAQDPSVLAKLRTLNVGERPTDWKEYTAPTADSA